MREGHPKLPFHRKGPVPRAITRVRNMSAVLLFYQLCQLSLARRGLKIFIPEIIIIAKITISVQSKRPPGINNSILNLQIQ
jgi:hypothetical protein